MKVELELPEIEGYEYTGEFRPVRTQEYYLDTDNVPLYPAKRNGAVDGSYYYPIMRPVAMWRDARPGDLENGPVECRCRDTTTQEWSLATLAAYSAAPSDELRYGMMDTEGELGAWFAYCQVKDNA